MNFWLGVLFRAGCAVCFCSEGDREMRTGRARSRENAAGRTWAIVSARKHVRTSETLHSENMHAVSPLFLPFKLFVDKNLRYRVDGTFWGFKGRVLRMPSAAVLLSEKTI